MNTAASSRRNVPSRMDNTIQRRKRLVSPTVSRAHHSLHPRVLPNFSLYVRDIAKTFSPLPPPGLQQPACPAKFCQDGGERGVLALHFRDTLFDIGGRG